MKHLYKQLVLFEHLLSDPLVEAYVRMHSSQDEEVIHEDYFYIVRTLIQQETTFEDYLVASIFSSEHPMLLELCRGEQEPTDRELACLRHDLYIIRRLFKHDLNLYCDKVGDDNTLLKHSVISVRQNPLVKAVMEFFDSIEDKPIFQPQCDNFLALLRHFGCGEFALHQAFYLNDLNEIEPSPQFSTLAWSHIYDYTYQKEALRLNTLSFLEGKPFHHVLLIGASGTGKSSSVKAQVQLFEHLKCRLVQLQKRQLQHLPKLLKRLAKSPFRFILFIDDLSFEVNEDDYKFLKSFIEGGIMNDAENVAFYVTSNRRHLIKEMRQEREQDIHLQDFIQEMTSLSDRFGLTLTYEPLTQRAYFEMVQKMCEDVGLVIPREQLETESRQWSLRHGGMSGRIASQWVKHMQM